MFTVIYHSLILSVSLRLLCWVVFFVFFNNAKIDRRSNQHVSWERWSFIYKFWFVWVFFCFFTLSWNYMNRIPADIYTTSKKTERHRYSVGPHTGGCAYNGKWAWSTNELCKTMWHKGETLSSFVSVIGLSSWKQQTAVIHLRLFEWKLWHANLVTMDVTCCRRYIQDLTLKKSANLICIVKQVYFTLWWIILSY